MVKDKILVLTIDRDDDLGRKASVKGPIIGRENSLKAATALGLADPEDSDTNAIFQTVKIFDEVKKQHKAEVAVLTGDRDVGFVSDGKITKQLDKVLKKFAADYVVFVSDGSEDEQLLPIIQSKVAILSVQRVIVKQSEQLESGYYKVKDFIQESLEDPRYARLVFGLPAIILILLGIFGFEGFKVVIFITGVYLFIKGFKLEQHAYNLIDELKVSLSHKRLVFFMYMLSVGFLVIGAYRGFVSLNEWISVGFFETIAGFALGSVYLIYLGWTTAWVGRHISVATEPNNRKITSVILFGLAIAFVVANTAELILKPSLSAANFILSIILGFGLLAIAIILEWKS